MSKIYLAISTDTREYENLKELTSVWESFDGLAVTYHGNTEDDAYKLLSERKKEGFIECIPYFQHHSHDLNHILFNPIIKLNNILILRDSGERLSTEFASNIRPFVKMLENNGINTVYQYSKLLMFRRFCHQWFTNTPHWQFNGAQPKMIEIEKTGWFKDDKEYCYSVRNEKRDKYHFINHFVSYYLILDGNHNLLGLENFGNPQELFPILEQQRINFLFYLQTLGIDNNINSLHEYVKQNGLNDKLKEFFNNNLILNQWYRFTFLNDLTVSPDLRAPIVKIL